MMRRFEKKSKWQDNILNEKSANAEFAMSLQLSSKSEEVNEDNIWSRADFKTMENDNRP